MSQHDYNIANGGGAAVRADINAALLAILSQNSGATAPATTKPFMFWYDTANGIIRIRNSADTAWLDYMNSSGQLVAPTATGLITALGGQIKFPATQNASSDANTLDDYEEGTWTPTYQTVSNDMANFSYAVQTGRYVKIGKLVTVTFSIATVNAASVSGTGGVQIRGLPFAVNDLSTGVPVPATTIDNRFTNNPFCGFVETGTGTFINLFKNQTMNSANYLTIADFNKTNSGNYNLCSGAFSYTTI